MPGGFPDGGCLGRGHAGYAESQDLRGVRKARERRKRLVCAETSPAAPHTLCSVTGGAFAVECTSLQRHVAAAHAYPPLNQLLQRQRDMLLLRVVLCRSLCVDPSPALSSIQPPRRCAQDKSGAPQPLSHAKFCCSRRRRQREAMSMSMSITFESHGYATPNGACAIRRPPVCGFPPARSSGWVACFRSCFVEKVGKCY